MDPLGLKRRPLSPLSPSSLRERQRRRCGAHDSTDGNGSLLCKENQNPLRKAQTFGSGGNTIPGILHKGSLKTSQCSGPSTAESVVNSENQHKYLKETCPAERKSFLGNRGENNPTRIPISRGNDDVNPGSGTSFGTTDDFSSPSQRRLRDVDLSAVTQRTPLARLIAIQSNKQSVSNRFQPTIFNCFQISSLKASQCSVASTAESFLPAEIDKTMSENRALLMGKHVVKILITQEKHINYVRCGLLFPCADLKNGLCLGTPTLAYNSCQMPLHSTQASACA
ncbi:uncharacterized protein LOC108205936 isoform X2 [Daucus carota subsp. sativus]|uniref:uncharacterized protein LOC108205936 isoform X2 n=1 Tax=Daucus carota subsp. sativus TaxID=79200 RepID=UPI003083321D